MIPSPTSRVEAALSSPQPVSSPGKVTENGDNPKRSLSQLVKEESERVLVDHELSARSILIVDSFIQGCVLGFEFLADASGGESFPATVEWLSRDDELWVVNYLLSVCVYCTFTATWKDDYLWKKISKLKE